MLLTGTWLICIDIVMVWFGLLIGGGIVMVVVVVGLLIVCLFGCVKCLMIEKG